MAFPDQQPPLHILVPTLASLIFLLLTTPTHSLTCSSQNITNNLYTHCTDLHTLNSSLRWTYVAKTSSLQIEFIAPPAHPQGWIAWALNRTSARMAGSQALIAFHDNQGSMVVKTYNISSYSDVHEGDIAFDVKELKGEYSDGTMKIYGTLKLPENMKEVNHVWQVGGEIVKGVPVRHAFTAENLKAIGKLKLELREDVGSPVVAPSPSTTSDGYRNTVRCVFFVMVIIWALMLN